MRFRFVTVTMKIRSGAESTLIWRKTPKTIDLMFSFEPQMSKASHLVIEQLSRLESEALKIRM